MRRFITLIDALYEESVQVIILADEIPTKLLRLTPKEKASPHDEVREFREIWIMKGDMVKGNGRRKRVLQHSRKEFKYKKGEKGRNKEKEKEKEVTINSLILLNSMIIVNCLGKCKLIVFYSSFSFIIYQLYSALILSSY